MNKVEELQQKIYKEALEWVGTPWIHHQHQKGLGCDCIGLVIGVGNAVADLNFSWTQPQALKFRGYSRLPDPKQMKEGLNLWLVYVGRTFDKAQVGDILWVRINKEPQHLAILGPKMSIVHGDMLPKPKFPNGKVVNRRIRDEERQKLIGVFRYPKVAELMEE